MVCSYFDETGRVSWREVNKTRGPERPLVRDDLFVPVGLETGKSEELVPLSVYTDIELTVYVRVGLQSNGATEGFIFPRGTNLVLHHKAVVDEVDDDVCLVLDRLRDAGGRIHGKQVSFQILGVTRERRKS